MTIDMITVDHDSFAPYVGQSFTVDTQDGPLTLTLDSIKQFSEATRRDNELIVDGTLLPPRRAFALTFEGPRAPMMAQGTYRLRHPEAGELMLFLVPFRQDDTATLYESVIS